MHVEGLALVDVGSPVSSHVDEGSLWDLPHCLVQLLQVVWDLINVLGKNCHMVWFSTELDSGLHKVLPHTPPSFL